jgi:hypothetical protein
MISAKGLVKVIEVEGIKIPDKESLEAQLEKAISDDRIYIFKNKNNLEIGFVTWHEKYGNGNLYIFVNNLLILKEFRGQFNLLQLRDMLKAKYPTMIKFYWRNRKKGVFRYLK